MLSWRYLVDSVDLVDRISQFVSGHAKIGRSPNLTVDPELLLRVSPDVLFERCQVLECMSEHHQRYGPADLDGLGGIPGWEALATLLSCKINDTI